MIYLLLLVLKMFCVHFCILFHIFMHLNVADIFLPKNNKIIKLMCNKHDINVFFTLVAKYIHMQQV